MNKAGTLLAVVGVFAFLAVPLSASPTAGEAVKPAPWLVAQQDRPRPTCESDNRQMPRGTIVCREGRQLRCGPYGTWIDTGKAC